jgi:hypothetical protein
MHMNKIPRLIRFSPSMLDELKREAKRADLSVTQVVRQATAAWLKNRKRKRAS